MKAREKVMAFLAVILISVTGLGLIYFLYYSRSMTRLANQDRQLDTQLQNDEPRLQKLNDNIQRLKYARGMSLPADISLSQRLYGEELARKLKLSEFPADKTTIDAKAYVEAKTLGPAASKKPTMIPLQFTVKTFGDLSMLTDFLDRFYRTPLLHRIKSFSVMRPISSAPGQLPSELEVHMTIEALILDDPAKTAPNKRKALLPVPSELAPTLTKLGLMPDKEYLTILPPAEKAADLSEPLAHKPTQYAQIGGHDVFYGPPPPKPSLEPINIGDDEPPPPKGPTFNILPYVMFTGVTIDQNGTVATLFDAATEHHYHIKKKRDGTYRIDSYFYIKEKRFPLKIGEDLLALEDDEENVQRTFKVLRVDPTAMYLEEKDKQYELRVGRPISDVALLTKDQATKLGLPVKDDKKADVGKAKPGDKKDTKPSDPVKKEEPGKTNDGKPKPELTPKTDAATKDAKPKPATESARDVEDE